jgi:hypothetical protein
MIFHISTCMMDIHGLLNKNLHLSTREGAQFMFCFMYKAKDSQSTCNSSHQRCRLSINWWPSFRLHQHIKFVYVHLGTTSGA